MTSGTAGATSTSSVAPPAGGLQLRYHNEIQLIATCPPPSAKSPLGYGYRFAFEDLSDSRNHLPVAKISPSRFINEPPKVCCSALALSMYSTLPNLQKRAEAGVKNSPNFLKRVGNRFVQLNLSGAGRQTDVSNSGHFDFHEYTHFNFSACVMSAGVIPL